MQAHTLALRRVTGRHLLIGEKKKKIRNHNYIGIHKYHKRQEEGQNPHGGHRTAVRSVLKGVGIHEAQTHTHADPHKGNGVPNILAPAREGPPRNPTNQRCHLANALFNARGQKSTIVYIFFVDCTSGQSISLSLSLSPLFFMVQLRVLVTK